MGYLPNLLSGSSQDLFGVVLEARVKQKTGSGSGLRYFVYLTVELQQHPNKKRIYGCAYTGTLRFSLAGREYISHGDSHNAIQRALADGFTLEAITAAIKVALEGRPVSANQSGGLWFAT